MPAADKDTNLQYKVEVQNDLSRKGDQLCHWCKSNMHISLLNPHCSTAPPYSLLVANLHSCKQVVEARVNNLLWTSRYIGFHLYISSLDQLVYKFS